MAEPGDRSPVGATQSIACAPRRCEGLRSTAALALATLALLVAAPYALPGSGWLGRLRLLTPLPEGSGLTLGAARSPSDEAKVGEVGLRKDVAAEGAKLALPATVELPDEARQLVGPAEPGSKPPCSLEDPSGHALDPFFAALRRVDQQAPGAMARIAFWGDSNVAGDLVSGVLRRKLQARFGDGGHGFLLLAGPTEWDFANDVWRSASTAWSVSRIPGPLAADGLYGLGATSFRSQGAGAWARVGTAKSGELGRNVRRFTVDYLVHPGGAGLELHVDGALHHAIDTRGEPTAAALETIELPDGPHELELRALGPGVRIFGVWLERDGPGVVVDALGVTSAKIRYLGRIDRSHWHEQLRLRNPELLVFNFGVNESREGERQFGMEEYERTAREVLADVRTALPQAACLLVAPNDIAWKTAHGDMLSQEIVPKLGAVQRKLAAELGCGFWDMFEAMGGTGSMGRWVTRRLARPDMLHPTPAGAEVLGGWLYDALMERYRQFRPPAAG